MDADAIGGEVIALETEIDEILDFAKFTEEPEDLKEIIECIEKSEKLRREYIAKTVTLSKKDQAYNIEDSQERKNNLTGKLKEMRLQKKEITKKMKAEEDKSKAEEEERIETERKAEKKRIEDRARSELKVRKNQLMIRMETAHKAQIELGEAYNRDTKNVSDGEIERRKDDIKRLSDRFYNHEKDVIKIIEDLTVDLIRDTETKNTADRIQTMLETLREQKRAFEIFIEAEVMKRDLTKDKKEAASEIILEKFSGEDGIDYYSFKTKFEKKYQNVKRTQVADILKSYMLKSASESVKELTDVTEIWERLKDNFGDPNDMLKKKMQEIYVTARGTSNKRTAKETKENLIDLWNKLKDVLKLAKEHKIESKLFSKHEISDIVGKLPGWMMSNWYVIYVGIKKEKTDEEIWNAFLQYLETQIEIQKAKSENEYVPYNTGTKPMKPKSFHQNQGYQNSNENGECPLGCDKIHTKGQDLLECQKFLRVKNPQQRMEVIRSSEVKFCFQCLERFTGFEHRNSCSDEFACKHPNHENYAFKFHVSLCQSHCQEESNVKLFEEFKQKKMGSQSWATGIKLSFFSKFAYRTDQKEVKHVSFEDDDEEVTDESLYLLQKIEVEGNIYNVFYDDGCGSCVLGKKGADRLEGRAQQVCSTPIKMGGIGECVTVAQHGLYRFKLPLIKGKNAVLMGPCMDQITEKFPTFPMDEVMKEVKRLARDAKMEVDEWPATYKECGGDTDIMIGLKFRKYYPREIHRLPNGLSVFKSQFYGPNKSDGVIGGPSSVVTAICKQMFGEFSQFNKMWGLHSYFTEQLKIYEQGYQVDIDIARLGYGMRDEDVDLEEEDEMEMKVESYMSKKERKFHEYDEAGCNLDYRCPKCRGCSWCLNNEKLNAVSLQAEGEQHLIEESVIVDIEKGEVRAELPLLDDPKTKLGENKRSATRIYQQQVAKLSKNPNDKKDVLESEGKLQKRGHVMEYEKIPPEIKMKVEKLEWSHYIPWRAVWNSNSVTTNCRVVFDMSATTESGLSLNDLSPKGINQINNLLVVFIRWRLGREAIHSDITGMYPSVLLVPEFWGLQKYLWSEGLEPGVEPIVKVITRIIYGGKASSSIAISGVRKLADKIEGNFPIAAKILRDEIYVDDILPEGMETKENCHEVAAEIECGLAQGGMKVRGFTFSGEDPDEALSPDGETVSVAGMQWYSKDDLLRLKIGDKLNFSEKIRGKKKYDENSFKIPDPLTRRHAAGKVAELWDLSGLFTPRFKLDLHSLIDRELDWDDSIPKEMLEDWLKNFKLMEAMNQIKFARTVIPEDAESIDIDTIEAGDASERMIIIGVYTRLKRKNGSYSCQLTLGKSKLVPKGMTVARAELTAARLNSQAGHLVHKAIGSRHVDRVKLTDSEITLHWINAWSKPLKQFVRGSVVEILRMSAQEEWFWISSENNPCDVGTRRNVELSDVLPDSEWATGKKWMHRPKEEFPTKTVTEIKLSEENESKFKSEFTGLRNLKGKIEDNFKIEEAQVNHAREYEVECGLSDRMPVNVYLVVNQLPIELGKRLYKSKYIVDPSRFSFFKLVRINSIVFGFIRKMKDRVKTRKGSVKVEEIKIMFGTIQEEKLRNYFNPNPIKESNLPKVFLCSKEIEKIREKIAEYAQGLNKQQIEVTCEEVDFDTALQYLFEKGTSEVEYFCEKRMWKDTLKIGKIRYWINRVLDTQEFTTGLKLADVMLDLDATVFCVPILEEYSPLAWSIVNGVHWENPTAKHGGTPTVIRYCNQIAHVFNISQVAQVIKDKCCRCNYIRKRTVEAGMGPLSKHQLKLAPSYFISQCDLLGPLKAYSKTQARQTTKIWGCVFLCVTTSSCNVQTMEDYSTASFIQAYTRFACNNGHVGVILIDEGKQLMCGVKNMEIDWTDVKRQLYNKNKVTVEIAHVGDHHQHGKVERKIRQVKETIMKSFVGERRTALMWQTLFDMVSNSVNNLPIARNISSMSGVKEDVGNLDLITPNRLKFSRNNDMAPVGPILITNDVTKILRADAEVFRVWWDNWFDVALPKLLERDQRDFPKRNLEIGDVVLMKKHEGDLAGVYRFGIVEEAMASDDGVVRKVLLRYQNVGEKTSRTTTRSSNGVILIRRVDEIDVWTEMYSAGKICDLLYRMYGKKTFVYEKFGESREKAKLSVME